MQQQTINTAASVAAATFAAAALALGLWQNGADDRKVSAFREDCRSQIGATVLLINRSAAIAPDTSTETRVFLERDWDLLSDRLAALRAVAPTMGLERPAVDGVTDAADLASRWGKRTDIFYNYTSANQKTVDDFVSISRRIIEKAAGEVR